MTTVDTTESSDPMPAFVIKAKDILAVAVIGEYAALCEDYGLTDHAAEVRKSIDEIKAWRARHRDEVKIPDHPHVAVANGDEES